MKRLLALLMFAAFAATAAVPLPELNWVPGSDWLNVKSFGAKGDGTTDDTAASSGGLTGNTRLSRVLTSAKIST